MKLRNKIIAIAVVAVAGVNAYLANDMNARNNEVSLMNMENIAEAQECEVSELAWGTIDKWKVERCDGSREEICYIFGMYWWHECTGVYTAITVG